MHHHFNNKAWQNCRSVQSHLQSIAFYVFFRKVISYIIRFVLLAVRNLSEVVPLLHGGGRGHYLITTYTHVVQKRQVVLGVVKEAVANAGMIYVMNDGGEDGDEFVEGRHMSGKL